MSSGSNPRPLGHQAAIGLGANLPSPVGDAAATLGAAITSLSELGVVTARSSLYRTAPVGPVRDQQPFLNAAVLLSTTLPADALLEGLLALERRFGRDRLRTSPKGPRTLDLDLLLYGDRVISTPELVLPHPALQERRFVLAPLAEIAPGLVHPVLKQPISALLACLPPEGPNRPEAVQRLSR